VIMKGRDMYYAKINKCIGLLMVIFTLCAATVAQAQLNNVTGISVSEEESVTTITIQSDKISQYRYFTLAGDENGIVQRIVIDIEGARHAITGQTGPFGPVAGFRSSQFFENPPIVRVATMLRVGANSRVDVQDGNIVLSLSNYSFSEPVVPVVIPPVRQPNLTQIVQEKDSININVTNLTLGAVLQLFQIEHGMNILISKSVTREDRLSIFLTGRYEKENLFEAILTANEYKYYKPQDDLYVVLGRNVNVDSEMQVEIFKLNYIQAGDLQPQLELIKSTDGQVVIVNRSSMGSAGITIPSSSGGGGGGAGGNPLESLGKIVGDATAGQGISDELFVLDRPVVIERMRKIILALDVPVPQVHISVKVVETRLAESEKWGMNWQAMLEMVGVGGQASGSGSAGGAGGASALTNIPGLPLNIDDFRAGTLSLSQTKAMLDLLQRRENSKLLNQPSITTMHNEQVTIAIGTSIPIEVTQLGGAGGGASGGVTTVQNQNVAVTFTVIPRVNEGKYISLWVKPVIQEVSGFTGRNSDQPIISSRTATTQVRVKSGEVIMIGGLIKEDKLQTTSRVKFLSSIPLFGKLFTHNRVDVTRSELIIFITPDIVPTDLQSGIGPGGEQIPK
jgi:type II secretory pathway component GspD/PulD (secretin)